jgi:predicted ATPase with chaperone activity
VDEKRTKERDPDLPALCRVGEMIAPRAPRELKDVEKEERSLCDLIIKTAYMVPRCTNEELAKKLSLSGPVTNDLLGKICYEGQIEQTLQVSETKSHYRITEQGKAYAERLLEVCGYVGPAPVRMESYCALLRWQFDNTPPVQPKDVVEALSGLVLTQKTAQLAGLAASSGRSLFIYGPPGNGKSSLARKIHAALPGDYWMPYAIDVGENVIRLFDSHVHHKVDLGPIADHVDNRWVRVRRPMVVVGGELTLEMLDLIYIPSGRYYEAPPHLKANGGVFLVDDFGRERISPEQLLNRFITPMEHHIDYFTLRTGQKIQLPLRHILLIATNLSPEKVTDPAFLRRMGYRVLMEPPTPEQYAKIFQQYAVGVGTTASPEIVEYVLGRYKTQNRELRACEPRDIIERSRDICKFHGRPVELTTKIIDLAWSGYFGE